MERDQSAPTFREALAVGWLILWRSAFVAGVWWSFVSHVLRDMLNAPPAVLIAVSVVIGLVYWVWVIQIALIKHYRGFRVAIMPAR